MWHLETPMGMDDKTYRRLLNSCIDHFLKVLGPRLDDWAAGKTERWKSWARDDKTVQEEGRAHWQAEYHEEFRNLFEQEMAVFLREQGCSQADFAAVLRRAYAERAPGAESLGSLVIETMTAVDEFESFANFMDNAADGDDDDDGRAEEEEGKRAFGEYSERNSKCAADDTRTRRK